MGGLFQHHHHHYCYRYYYHYHHDQERHLTLNLTHKPISKLWQTFAITSRYHRSRYVHETFQAETKMETET